MLYRSRRQICHRYCTCQIVQADGAGLFSPAERGERLDVPQLVVLRGQQVELFRRDFFLSIPWRLRSAITGWMKPVLCESTGWARADDRYFR